MASHLRALGTLMALALRADRREVLLVAVLAPLAGLSGAAVGLGLKWLVDAAVGGEAAGLLAAGGLLAAAATGTHLLGTTAATRRMALQQRVALAVDRHILDLCTGLPTVEHHENPAYLDRLELLRTRRGEVAAAVGAPLEALRTVARFASTIGLLAALDPRLLLLPALALPATAASSVAQRILRRAGERAAVAERRRRWLFRLGTSPEPAKEIRVYRLDQELRSRHDDLLLEVQSLRQRAELRAALLSTGGWLVFGAGYLGAVAVMLGRAAAGQATPGDVALAVTLAAQVNGAVAGAVGLLGMFQGALQAAGYYLWLVDYARSAAPAPALPARRPRRFGELVLQDVSFTYPGTAAPVLEGISLRLAAGTTVALVGENGAGKSTLVKLLCRLYEPTSGRILLDGTDLREVSVGEWRARLAAGFQDFCRFELLARESIGVGDLPRAGDEPAVRAALSRAGGADLPGQLPAGLATQLGRVFEGGTDLSVGQWQKVAMGRAMMRPAPLLVVFDEPTASMDAGTEHAMFARWASVASERPDTVTLLVSHRFSTVRLADVIAVLDGGRVRQVGTHEELMAAGGQYADLYRLHASAYGDGPSPAAGAGHGSHPPPVR